VVVDKTTRRSMLPNEERERHDQLVARAADDRRRKWARIGRKARL
jgi:hypothetical protein